MKTEVPVGSGRRRHGAKGGHRALVRRDGRTFRVRVPASAHFPALSRTAMVPTHTGPSDTPCLSLFITVCCSLW